MKPLPQRVKDFADINNLFKPEQTVLLAVSGGIDSMVMLHIFSELSRHYEIGIKAAHVNHQLRGSESDEDEKFVISECRKTGIPVFVEHVNVKEYAHEHCLSKQAAARILRYQSLEKIRLKTGAHVVATAHQADDNAETVLLNILRGTGIRGMAGIPLKRNDGYVIRPILCLTRNDIESYAEKHDIKFRNDSSNLSLVYRRNFLRHKIIPVLEKRSPHIINTLNKIASVMRPVSDQLRDMVEEKLASLVRKDNRGIIILDVKSLENISEFLRNEIFMEIIRGMNIEPTEKKVDSLCRLCSMPSGRIIEIGGSISALKDRERIIFKKTEKQISDIQHLEIGRNYEYQGYKFSIGEPGPVPKVMSGTGEVEYIDADKLSGPLVLRPWHAGDWFIPLGMRTKKKVSDYFTDQKVPRYKKKTIPVLEADGSIVWVCGKRLDNRYKLTEHTKTAIRLAFQPQY
ncbi:MAG: tRNA lysidine(34) synthetase TilS [Bacteroidetes bacterium]|nr:tRNA lysidine(34) synthetase TilS [Bacteroidota bacterium]